MHARRIAGCLAGLLLLLAAPAQAAEPGVHAGRIVFGQAAPLDGPAQALGRGMRAGLLAAFAEANAAGGIQGRRLELTSLDDGYEPERTKAATRRLIEDEAVFALAGSVGTPTSRAAQPIAEAAGVPFIGAFTGAAFLRDPALGHVVNLRASYDQETEAWIEHLTGDLGIQRIAILYQDDSFGEAGLAGVKAAMAKRGLSLVASGSYPRNTSAVKSALLQIRKARPGAVVMVGAYAPCAEFIRAARRLRMNPVFVNISFVGSDALAAALGPDGAGVVVSQVVPLPDDATLPVVAAYQAALRRHAPETPPGFVSLEGYLVGRMVAEALRGLDGEPTRRGLIERFRAMRTLDLGGLTLRFGPDDNQALDRVFFTVLQPDGRFRAVERLERPAS